MSPADEGYGLGSLSRPNGIRLPPSSRVSSASFALRFRSTGSQFAPTILAHRASAIWSRASSGRMASIVGIGSASDPRDEPKANDGQGLEKCPVVVIKND